MELSLHDNMITTEGSGGHHLMQVIKIIFKEQVHPDLMC